jgi:hypothetical protein
MARPWVPSGVDSSLLGLGAGNGLAPTLAAGPTINVTAGGCWLDGHYAELATPASIPATANGLLVVRFTPADNHAELLYRDAAVTCTQTLATWELPVAQMVAGAMNDIRWFANTSGELAISQNTGTVAMTASHTAASPIDIVNIPAVYLDGGPIECEVTVLTMGFTTPTSGSVFETIDVWADNATMGSAVRAYAPGGSPGWGRLRRSDALVAAGVHRLRARGWLQNATAGAVTLTTLRVLRI